MADDTAEPTGTEEPSLAALLGLIRWPGVLTAAANAAAGFLLAHRPEAQSTVPTALGVVAGGALVYAGGVVLNDVADAGRDLTLHPTRPIPSGRATRGSAALFGVGLCATGIATSIGLAGLHAGLATAAAALFATAYDFGGKRSRIAGSLLMGLARGANGLAGALAAVGSLALLTDPPSYATGAAETALLYPVAIGLYTVLLTFTSTFEEGRLGRRSIAFLAGAMAFVAVLPWPLFLAQGWRLAPAPAFVLLVGSLLIGARDAMEPGGIGLGALIRSAVFGFLLIDAAWLAGIGKYDWGAGMLIAYLALRLVLARARS
jgi:UbiA prenyltransferase family protein